MMATQMEEDLLEANDQWEADMAVLSDDELQERVNNCLVSMGIDALVGDQFNALKLQLDEVEKQKIEIDRIMEETQELSDSFIRNNSNDDQDASSSGSYEVHEIDSDSDDDVKFIEATFDPSKRTNNHFTSFQLGGSERVYYNSVSSNAAGSSPSWPLSQQPRSVLEIPPKPIPITVGMKVFAKKSTETWHKAAVTAVVNGDTTRYKIKFEGRGLKTVDAKQLATVEIPREPLLVGTRVVSMYHFEDGFVEYYSGMIAEPPNNRNNGRYLMFFDDGYAQYSKPNEVHCICEQSKNVWEDTSDDCRDFFKLYLEQYPERPMVRMMKGQHIKTEWKGKWWLARVQEVDCSLVQMYFDSDRRFEWIYRGSTRLEPLFTQLAHAEAARQAGRGGRKYGGPSVQGNNKPIVEYTRLHEDLNKGDPESDGHIVKVSEMTGKSRAVAKKSTTSTKLTPAEAAQRKSIFQASSISRNPVKQDAAAILQEKLAASVAALDEEHLGERMSIDTLSAHDKIRLKYEPHVCSLACLKNSESELAKYKGHNPLLIPLLINWERHFVKYRGLSRRAVFYRAPCARRLRSIEELDSYLQLTDSKLPIDYFSYDADVETDIEYVPVKTFCDIKDVSYGKENVKISCVNGIDRSYPDYVEYSCERQPGKGVFLTTDSEFLVGCDCTDGCRDRSKCSCIQLTLDAQKVLPGDYYDPQAGYQFKRLKEPRITGIYECNPRCRCDHRCHNRVVQHGLQLRLQIFKTEKKGWGLRCLDDIPAGGFVCIYAGQLLTEQGANEDGKNYGDEFLAELDCIEVVERMKEGYESDVPEDEMKSTTGSDSDETSESATDAGKDDDSQDSDFAVKKSHKKKSSTKDDDCKKIVLKRQSKESKNEQWSVKSSNNKKQRSSSDAIVISDNDSENMGGVSSRMSSSDADELPDLEPATSNDASTPGSVTHAGAQKLISCLDATIKLFDSAENDSKKPATRSTARRHFGGGQKSDNKKSNVMKEKKEYISTRSYFGEDFCYVMDAKSVGNIGRYLNHSCNPNCFVQNVFVDTHDLRFPWVAFFAQEYVRAGTELTWDYNYEVGSVPGKSLNCYCGSESCRGRLL